MNRCLKNCYLDLTNSAENKKQIPNKNEVKSNDTDLSSAQNASSFVYCTVLPEEFAPVFY